MVTGTGVGVNVSVGEGVMVGEGVSVGTGVSVSVGMGDGVKVAVGDGVELANTGSFVAVITSTRGVGVLIIEQALKTNTRTNGTAISLFIFSPFILNWR
jgi:hypothetical protein